MRVDEIVAYTFQAEILCPPCTIRSLPTGEGQAFAGWEDLSEPPMSAEANLTELAAAFCINREDETTFDSGDFPKVVFAEYLDPDERCGSCGCSLP